MISVFINKFFKLHWFLLVFTLAALIVSIQLYILPPGDFWGGVYCKYNNFVIFKQSFFHLIEHKNLYIQYPAEYGDFFKYSPSFALLFAPISALPNLVGLMVWNTLNCLVLVYAIIQLPDVKQSHKYWFALGISIELITSTQSSQSNALIAGLILLSLVQVKKEKYFLSALLISLGAFIKIYCAAGFLVFFFARDKKKFFIYSLVCMTAILVLPSLVIGPADLIQQYKNWGHLLAWDMNDSVGSSIYGIFNVITGNNGLKLTLQIIGLALLLLPLFFISLSDEKKQLQYTALLLIWLVLFNHKAESATFIIAFTGAVLWFTLTNKNYFSISIFIICFILCCLSQTDLFPRSLRTQFINYHVKAWPFVILFFYCFIDLIRPEKLKLSV